MKAKSIFNYKGNNSSHSSIDSGNSQEEIIVEKIKSEDEIIKIKQKLQGDSKAKLSELITKQRNTDWSKFYEKFMNDVVSNKNITSKEMELRINLVLNSIKYNSVKEKHFQDDQKVGNCLLQKNKFEFCNKKKFIPIVMSKYNSFLNDPKEDVSKRSPMGKNTYSSFGRSLLKKPTSKNLEGFERKKTVFLDSPSTTNKNFRASVTLRKNTTLFARQSTKNVNSTNMKTIELKPSQDLNKSLGSTKNLRDTIKSNDNSFSYERGNETAPAMYPNFIKLFKNSNIVENSMNLNLPDSNIKENLESLKHDIKSYEKELMISDGIFKLPQMRELKHFFSFDGTIEAIQIGKSLKKFNNKSQLDAKKKNIDNIIKKIINS